jgi:hypothetical protein
MPGIRLISSKRVLKRTRSFEPGSEISTLSFFRILIEENFISHGEPGLLSCLSFLTILNLSSLMSSTCSPLPPKSANFPLFESTIFSRFS